MTNKPDFAYLITEAQTAMARFEAAHRETGSWDDFDRARLAVDLLRERLAMAGMIEAAPMAVAAE